MDTDIKELPKTLVISREGTGDGGSVSGTRSMVAETPEGQPDILVQKWPAWKSVLVRAGRVFIAVFGSGVISAQVGLVQFVVRVMGGDGDAVAAANAINTIRGAFASGMIAFIWSAGQNTAELWFRLDESRPKLRG